MQIEDIEEWRLAIIRMTPPGVDYWDGVFGIVHNCFEFMKSNSFTCIKDSIILIIFFA